MSVSRQNSAFSTGDSNQILNSQAERISSLLLSIDGSNGSKQVLLDGSTANAFRIAPVNQTPLAYSFVTGAGNWNFASHMLFNAQNMFYPTTNNLQIGDSANSTMWNVTIDTNDAGLLILQEDANTYASLGSNGIADAYGNTVIVWGSNAAARMMGNSNYKVNSSQLQVAGTKVVGAQGVAIADASVLLTSVTTQLNLLLAACRTHGLIAT